MKKTLSGIAAANDLASPPRTQDSPPGPVPGTRTTETYIRTVARDIYVWAWPMINIYNRRLAFKQAPKVGLMNGVLPFAPLNRMAMLSDYIQPSQRWVACPNQDVVYGAGIAALDETAVVVQVPDFGKRFWVYQLVDLRTDSFARLGVMHGSKPGFYLLVGPTWDGAVPEGINGVFRSSTSTAFVVPRVFQDDTPEDKQAIQSVITGIDMYPLAEFDGTTKQRDWHGLPELPSPTGDSGSGETRWVFPDKFIDELSAVLADAPPMPGEEARYAQAHALIELARNDAQLKQAVLDEATRAEQEVVTPLLQFRNFGIPLANHWTTVDNSAQFGTDYFTRTAIAKSNILVNAPAETKYVYQDLDASGARLNGHNKYTITFAKGQLPPVRGFWSLTMYDAAHFFVENPIQRYSLGTKNRDLKSSPDGSLTLYVQTDEPGDPLQRSNWLPAPRDADFSLFVRAYWPDAAITDKTWTPPGVVKAS
ncbi:DUF1254 domain-containing protein [Variovorax sp. J22R115]|uniref:DUF1254 domain-containing protein n=1 Tax=Variovorax sp. J22R115 TaxID=3053509 RepID=UPI0025762E0A|nr:DUF1254 domain-containing protein [Variovorax sp. J22R115]MDM0047441.1 DUF1214 domain-containing protein [Variovorax sp. J22R115]